MANVMFKGTEYPLATTLRVAYRIQGQHNHKPYAQIFESVGSMTLEDQIGMIYEAFLCGSRFDLNVQNVKRNEFLEDFLDNYNLSDMMGLLQAIIEGIVGKLPDNTESKEASGN